MKFNDYECDLEWNVYPNGNIRLVLIDSSDGIPVATASVYVSDKLQDNEIVIKNYSENEGIYDVLLLSDVVLKTHRRIIVGVTVCPVCRINPDIMNDLRQRFSHILPNQKQKA